MTNLVSAAFLTQVMDEIAMGVWTDSGHLSQISATCLDWKLAYPGLFNQPYERFERARQAVRYEAKEGEWTELDNAAAELGKAFRAAADMPIRG